MILLPIVSTWASKKGHRILVQIIPGSWQEFWDKWELRALVLISLLSQLILLFVTNSRKYRRDIWIRVLVWSAYMIADWVPSFAMGVISGKVGEYYDKSGQQKNGMDPQLIAFWAPFFLIHLSGPFTISAYALEDSELWLRHLLSLVSQTLMTSYLILLSWKSTTSRLCYLSFPMLIVGILKYSARIWCPYCCRISNLRDTLLTKLSDDLTPHFIGFLVSLSTDVILNQRHLSLNREKFQNDSHDDAFSTIRRELDAMYDMLYTTKPLIYQPLGLILTIFNFIVTIVVLFSYNVYVGSHWYSQMDHLITLMLLIIVLILEFVSGPPNLFWQLDLVLMDSPLWILNLRESVNRRDLLEQCNFLNLILDEKDNGSGRYFSKAKKLGLLCESVKPHCVTHWDVSDDLREMIFNYFKNKSRGNLSDMSSREYKNIILSKLRIQVSPSTFEFHKTIIAWHIATDLFFYSHEESEQEHSFLWKTKNLSDYMFFLLMKRRYMLPVGAGLVSMRHTLSVAREIFSQIPEDSSKSEAVNMLLGPPDMLAQEESTHKDDESVLIEAVKIAKQLLSGNREDMRALLGELWIEILGYAATHCKLENHAQQLRRGGEFLTQIWLLQAHFGLLDQFHHIEFEDNSEIPQNSPTPEPQEQRSLEIM